MVRKVTFDTTVKPKFYLLLGYEQRKVLGNVKFGDKVRVTVEMLEDG